MPDVTFQSKVFHPLVHYETGKVKLSHEFKEWVFGKNWVINILLFVKKMFHLQDFFNLHTREDAWNKQAFDLYLNNF